MNEDTRSTLIDRLRDVGLRATSSRVAILDHLQTDRRHPTAEMVYASLHTSNPSLSLSTVYSTLENFIDRGLLRRVHTPDGLLRVDGTIADHDHAICQQCGAVYDVARRGIRSEVTPELPLGLRFLGVKVEYEVLCSDCGEHAMTAADGSAGNGQHYHPAEPGPS